MGVLKRFSEKERDYHLYQARMNFLREQSAIQGDMEELEQRLAEARRQTEQEWRRAQESSRREEQERAAKEAALAEVERLKALLNGRNPQP